LHGRGSRGRQCQGGAFGRRSQFGRGGPEVLLEALEAATGANGTLMMILGSDYAQDWINSETIENRARLLLETVHRIKDALPDFALWVRISCTEYCDDGYPIEDMIAVAKMLEAAGVAALDLSGGTNESPALSRFFVRYGKQEVEGLQWDTSAAHVIGVYKDLTQRRALLA